MPTYGLVFLHFQNVHHSLRILHTTLAHHSKPHFIKNPLFNRNLTNVNKRSTSTPIKHHLISIPTFLSLSLSLSEESSRRQRLTNSAVAVIPFPRARADAYSTEREKLPRALSRQLTGSFFPRIAVALMVRHRKRWSILYK